MALLPTIPSKDAYLAVRRDAQVWQPAMDVIAQRHGLGALRRAPTGTHVVFLGEDRVVKLFAPPWPEDYAAEQRMLDHVAGRLPVATPEIVARGDVEGWPYLVLTRLPGRPLTDIWDELDAAERRRQLTAIGSLGASLHALPLPIPELEARQQWAAFLSARRERLVAKHTSEGVAPTLVAQIEAFVARLPADAEWAGEVATLHTDLHGAHLLIRSGSNGWELCGLFDFGDAMVGAPEHELIAPAAFIAPGVPGGLRALLRGHGYPEPERDAGLRMRLSGHLLLQRYCALPALFERLGYLEPPTELENVLDRLWDLGEDADA